MILNSLTIIFVSCIHSLTHDIPPFFFMAESIFLCINDTLIFITLLMNALVGSIM